MGADPQPGTLIAGRYLLGPPLGRGGMGRVHVARDQKLQRDVALKTLSAPAPDPEALRRFEREALAEGALQHPNVVSVFDVGEEGGRPFIVTELLRGETLRERLAREKQLAPAEVARIAAELAAGLGAAHAKGLVHRDLKPENVFITREGWVKILDFGLVKLAETLAAPEQPAPDQASTGDGRMLGTVGYMAPEQVRGASVDRRADLFNLGLLVYEMLAGDRAFKGASPTETAYAILFKEPEALPRTVPRPLRDTVRRCLAKDREQRPDSAAQVGAILEGRNPPPPNRANRRVRSLSLAAAAALAVVVVVGLFWQRTRRPPALVPSKPPAGTVAILPFSSRDAPRFAYLGDGIVDLLARDFEGGQLRAVDSASVFRALAGDESGDLDRVRAASVQLGASYFVLGRIEERRGKLVLEAVLHSADAGAPVSAAAVEGDPSNLLRLVRQFSDQLQARKLHRDAFEERVDRLARTTTRSGEALEAWLEGERLRRRGHWDREVVRAFQRAVSADPEFALAHYRLGVVASTLEPGLAEDAFQRALRNGDRLSPSERALAEARLAVQQGRLRAAEQLLVAATRAYPEEAEAWMQLGEFYFHQNPLRGRPAAESVGPFQHALVLDPLNNEAVSHLADLAQMRGERALAAKLSDRLLSMSDDITMSTGYRLARAWARADSAEHDKVIEELRAPGIPRLALKNAFVRAAWQMDGFRDAEAVAAIMTGSGSAAETSYGSYLSGVVALLRGRPDAAAAALRRASETAPDEADAAFFLPWIGTLPFFVVTDAQVAAFRSAAARIEAPQGDYRQAARAWLEGALAVRARDFAAAEKAARDLEAMEPLQGSSITQDFALSLRARLLMTQGDPAGALAALDKQRLVIPRRYAPYYVRMREAFLRGMLLEQLGRPADAIEAYDSLMYYSTLDPVFAAVANLRKATLLDASGDTPAAAEHYQRFAELWKDAEPAQQPAVERARARLREIHAQTASRAAR